MFIHTNKLTPADIFRATAAAGMHGVDAHIEGSSGSRSRDRKYKVRLTGTSNRWANSGKSGADRQHSATWDEWGMFIQALFLVDPEAIVGQYKSFDAFRDFTHNRFESLTATFQHGNHKWTFAGTPRCFVCRECETEIDYNHLEA